MEMGMSRTTGWKSSQDGFHQLMSTKAAN